MRNSDYCYLDLLWHGEFPSHHFPHDKGGTMSKWLLSDEELFNTLVDASKEAEKLGILQHAREWLMYKNKAVARAQAKKIVERLKGQNCDHKHIGVILWICPECWNELLQETDQL